jgi:Lrp/AsnC family transcriptional regulator, leucine-responsive regulatory protein
VTVGNEVGWKHGVDRIDCKLLSVLQDSGRTSITELATLVHLSVTACTERVRRLEREGFIRGYHAELDPRLLERTLLAYVQVQLNTTTPDVFERFKDAMMTSEEVLECHMVGGGFDYLLKIRVRDMTAYRKFLGEQVAGVRGVMQTHTYFVMEEVKSTHAIAISVPDSNPRRTPSFSGTRVGRKSANAPR